MQTIGAWPEFIATPPRERCLEITKRFLVEAAFEEPDLARFPCLRLAREAGEAGGCAPAVLNAANEVAVEAFLRERITFPEIPEIIEECLGRIGVDAEPTLENFHEADGFTREEALRAVDTRASGGTIRAGRHAS